MTLSADKANIMAVLRPQVRLTQGSEPGPARFTARIQRSRAVAPYSEYSLALAQPCLSDQAQSAVGPGLLGSAAAYLAIPKATLYTWRTRRVGFGPRAVKMGDCLRYRRADRHPAASRLRRVRHRRAGRHLAPLLGGQRRARDLLGAIPLRLARRAGPHGPARRNDLARALERLEARALHERQHEPHLGMAESS